MMLMNDILDDIVSGLQPEDVPVAFIVCAKIIDDLGIERVVRGEELRRFMLAPERENCVEARVVLDVRKIRASLIADLKEFSEHLDAVIAASGDAH